MGLATVSTIFGYLSILSFISGIGLIGLIIAANFSPGSAKMLADLRSSHNRNALMFAAYIAAFCMLGSLYLSEIAHLVPCRYCWFQRIFMYPLAFILMAGFIRSDYGIKFYGLLLSGIGGLISLYHIRIQVFNIHSTSCDPMNPCTTRYLDVFGFMTIPMMAFAGFLLIFALLHFVEDVYYDDENE